MNEIISVWHVERVILFYIHWLNSLIFLLTLSVGYSQSKSMPLKPYCFAKLTILSASIALDAALFTTCKYKLLNVLWHGNDGMLSPSWLRYSQCTYVLILDSIAVQVTNDGLDGPGFEYWQRQALFSSPQQSGPVLWPIEPPIQWVKESSI